MSSIGVGDREAGARQHHACRTWRSGRFSAPTGRSTAAPSASIAAVERHLLGQHLVPQRHVAGAARRGGQREPDQLRAHRVQRRRSRYRARRTPAAVRLGDPGAQGLDGGDALVRAETVGVGGRASAGVGWPPRQRHLGRRRPAAPARGRARPRPAPAARSCCGSPARAARRPASAGPARAATSASSGSGSGASSRSVTSSREMRALSACSISMSRRFDGFIAGAAASTVSRSPNSLISCAAPFGPMPGTPGTLSTRIADQRLHVDHLVRR